MKNTLKTLTGAAVFAATFAMTPLATTTTFAAEPILGNWKTATGERAAVSKCGGSFCITLKTGDYAGKRIGRLSGSGGNYKGKITDPTNNKTYSGSASISGKRMNLKGCVALVLCRSQKWSKL